MATTPDLPAAKTFYTGGATLSDTAKTLPVAGIKDEWEQPEGYVASQDLIAAVNVAITLGRPLLVTGEPGTGKSELAKNVACNLGLGKPLEFIVKSDTESRDLFYRFDAVGRFNTPRGNGGAENIDATAFIAYSALGEAILRANDPETVERYWRPGTAHTRQQRSVVLIDEMDKAPRDVPNDILSEIDRLEFEIPELSLEVGQPVKVKADPRFRPIVIITSNLEKSLPDAFLRRCVYFHLPFPDEAQLQEIVASRLGGLYRQHNPLINEALSLFRYLREPRLGLHKAPATAELLDWLYVLFNSVADKTPPPALQSHPRFVDSVKCCLLKNQVDQQRAQKLFDDWVLSRSSKAG